VENQSREHARPDRDPGPAVRRALSRRQRGSRVLRWFVIFLALLAVGQAIIFIPILSELTGRDDPPAARDVNLPERVIRVFSADGEFRLLLKNPLDLPEADGERARRLDTALFPGAGPHRYFVLHAVNPGGSDLEIDLGPLRVVDSAGRVFSPVDLAKALRDRGPDLPDYLRFYVSVRLPGAGRLALPAGSTRDVLVAFPGSLDPAKIERATLGTTVLKAEEMRKDELDGFLESPSRKRE